MELNILWKGLQYHLLENNLIVQTNLGYEIISTIVGNCEETPCRVNYCIHVNKSWEVVYARISAELNQNTDVTVLEKKDRQWHMNGDENKYFEGIRFIDISLTPFTNTLPINCLQLSQGERKVIEVIYFDILEKEIKPSRQVYTKLSECTYLFENFDGGFSAEIEVDKYGLVTRYPELFEIVVPRETD
ncbi:MAG: putative glycolipid-binding domain-containing protein [Mucilaginibacter sp.]